MSKSLAEILYNIKSEDPRRFYNDFRYPQTPGIGGLNQLTTGEINDLQQINSLDGSANDAILFWDADLGASGNWNLLTAGTNITITGTVISASVSGGNGNVVGPASSSARAIAVFTTTTGTALGNTISFIDTSGNIYPQTNNSGSLGLAATAWANVYVAGNVNINGNNAATSATSLDLFKAPQANVSWNSQKITSLLDPTAAQDAATKNYVDLYKLSTPVAITLGGTGATSSASARTNLGLVIGTNVEAQGAGLDALQALSTTGFAIRTGANTWTTGTIQGTSNQVTVVNGDGVSGNATLSLPQNIATASTPQFAAIGLGIAPSNTANSLINLASLGNIIVNGQKTKRVIVLSGAGGWASSASAGSATGPSLTIATNQLQNLQTIKFAAGSNTAYAEWTVIMPDSYDGQSITASFVWMANNATTSAVAWGIQCRAYTSGQNIDQSWSTPQIFVDKNQSTAFGINISAATTAFTPAGSPGGNAMVQFRVLRDPTNSGDNLNSTSAELIAVKIKYSTSAYTD